MKKIILTLLISTISLSSLAGIFHSVIPQPDFISDDWDGDGIPNSIDNDDDNDGIDDDVDSNPFGQDGQNSSPNINFNYFNSDKDSTYNGSGVTLSWSVDNYQDLNIYKDFNLIDLVQNVSSISTLEVFPTETTTYYLNYESGVAEVTIDVIDIPSVVGSSYTVSTSNAIPSISLTNHNQAAYDDNSILSYMEYNFSRSKNTDPLPGGGDGIITVSFPEAKLISSIYISGGYSTQTKQCYQGGSNGFTCAGGFTGSSNGDGRSYRFTYACILDGVRTELGKDTSNSLYFSFGNNICDQVEIKEVYPAITDTSYQQYYKTYSITDIIFY